MGTEKSLWRTWRQGSVWGILDTGAQGPEGAFHTSWGCWEPCRLVNPMEG